MKCYLDSEGYLISLNPVEGGIETDAPELQFGTSQHRLVDGAWIVSDVTPQRVLDEIAVAASKRVSKVVLTERFRLLAESDWTDTASAPARLGETTYAAWQTYRQALRDIPEQSGYPLNVVWPIAPSA